METPNVTQVQAVAFVAAAIDLAVQFGVALTDGQQLALIAFFGVLASIVLADAHIRNGRAGVASTQIMYERAAESDEAADPDDEAV